MPVFAVSFDMASAFWAMALLGTIMYVIKVILVLVGGDGGDADFTDGGDVHHGGGDGFTVLSLQSVLAFFMGAGWFGLAALKEWGMTHAASSAVSLGAGLFMMLINAGLMFALMKLNQENVYDVATAIGHVGKVYLVIPAKGEGTGQVEVSVSGRRKVLNAVSAGEKIPTDALVEVVEVQDGEILVVKRQGT